ncbi:MAG: tRNA preQ1(34) S-adenosylmethionine ribosyltransferase-isomerase QueA [Deltaproteobacteria bacterium]|nr:tRNA preQ1(34) S-adenosylmethionine ribosyltransferase-isomerase QueA [Deltaproteobacteria bacterium]
MYQLSDYDFTLPEEFISQEPASQRDQSRLLVLDRDSGGIAHRSFFEITGLLSSRDLIVVNNTRVVPGRLVGQKETGGKVELLILDYTGGLERLKENGKFECSCLIKASKRLKTGTLLFFDTELKARITGFKDGIYQACFILKEDFAQTLDRIGNVPLPPYIKREKDPPACDDRTAYQTVYAEKKGAIAAPTAGLHFSRELLRKIKSKGIPIVEITLHVGYGTFLPIRVEDIREHKMHSERFSISKKAAEAINQKKMEGGRIIAVGTTSVRTLEYATDDAGIVKYETGNCDLFIYPGYRFRTVDSMITNFHLPKSSLLMLVSAFAGREKILAAYREAIREKYRFYSYGDAMFIG